MKETESKRETEEKSYVDVGYKKEEQIASDYIEVHILEIPKFKRSNAGVKEKLEQWMWLFAGRKDMIEMAKKMLQRKINSQEIMEITGLKESEIKAIVV